MRKLLRWGLLPLVLLLIFKGILFRTLISYERTGSRPAVKLTDEELIGQIELQVEGKRLGQQQILEIAERITTDLLSFTNKNASSNPNRAHYTGKANCVGYAATFSAVVNYLLEKQGLQDEIQVHHRIGKVHLLGINLHRFFRSPFFKDHDYNEVVILKNGKTIALDLTITDYLGVRRITAR
jgi:hypothetical protein